MGWVRKTNFESRRNPICPLTALCVRGGLQGVGWVRKTNFESWEKQIYPLTALETGVVYRGWGG